MTGLQKGTREVCFLYKSDDNQVNKNTLVINEDTTAQLKCVCLHLSVPAAELRQLFFRRHTWTHQMEDTAHLFQPQLLHCLQNTHTQQSTTGHENQESGIQNRGPDTDAVQVFRRFLGTSTIYFTKTKLLLIRSRAPLSILGRQILLELVSDTQS